MADRRSCSDISCLLMVLCPSPEPVVRARTETRLSTAEFRVRHSLTPTSHVLKNSHIRTVMCNHQEFLSDAQSVSYMLCTYIQTWTETLRQAFLAAALFQAIICPSKSFFLWDISNQVSAKLAQTPMSRVIFVFPISHAVNEENNKIRRQQRSGCPVFQR